MSSRRFAGPIIGAFFSLALGACATAGGSDVDAGRGELPDAADRADADPEAPDAAPKPDAAPEPDAPLPDAEPPPPPDAMPGTPDAAPLPDAPPCTPTTRNLLMNPGFDSGPGGGWTETSAGGFALITTVSPAGDLPHAAQAGTFAAFLGGYNAGFASTATDRLLQSVTIPASTTALRIKGFRWIETEELAGDGPFDRVFFELLPAQGDTALETFGSFSNQNVVTDWTAFDLPAAATHAGLSVRLSIRSNVDDSRKTNFLVDSLVLEATVCE